MSYTITLKDRRTLVVGDSGTPKSDVEEAMLSGAPVRVNGMVISGSSIATVQDGQQDGEYGPHLTQLQREAGQVFLQASSNPNGFNAQAFKIALERAKQGKVWIHKDLLDLARVECGGTSDAAEVYAFLDAEWNRFKAQNTPGTPKKKVDPGVAHLSRKFFETDEGKQYASAWTAVDREARGRP